MQYSYIFSNFARVLRISMLYIKTFYCNPYRECTYILTASEPTETPQPCLIIDPGMYGEKEEKRVLNFLEEHHLTPAAILITHKHPDHVCGLECLQAQFPDIPLYGFRYQMPDSEETSLTLASLTFRVLHTPGHKEDSVCYYFEADNVLFTGDTLFLEGVGRTDLPGGDYATLSQSLKRLKTLPENTNVYAGHGYPTSIAHEKQYNPYL